MAFNLSIINLGPFPALGCPKVNFHPTAADRIMEGVALLIMLSGWVVIFGVHHGEVGSDEWLSAILSTVVFLLMLTGAYTSSQRINYPVRVNPNNIARQYILVVRLTRAINICICLLFASSTWGESRIQGLAALGSLVLMAVLLLVYYILAFRSK